MQKQKERKIKAIKTKIEKVEVNDELDKLIVNFNFLYFRLYSLNLLFCSASNFPDSFCSFLYSY